MEVSPFLAQKGKRIAEWSNKRDKNFAKKRRNELWWRKYYYCVVGDCENHRGGFSPKIFTNKFKFVVLLFSTVVFAFILFPFDDLSDLVSTQVSKATSGRVYVQFDHMNLSLLPLGLRLEA